jgi:hypothetical protein
VLPGGLKVPGDLLELGDVHLHLGSRRMRATVITLDPHSSRREPKPHIASPEPPPHSALNKNSCQFPVARHWILARRNQHLDAHVIRAGIEMGRQACRDLLGVAV